MTEYYKVAGLTVAMDSFGRTRSQAEPYRCPAVDHPDIVISANLQSIKRVNPALSDEDCEYLATGAEFYSELLNFEGMMLHASAVVMDGAAYLFSAPCGTGKSTHTTLWQKVFGDRVIMLNDDKPAIRLENGEFFAYGTPWCGKTGENTNLRVPLGGICMLRRGEVNEIHPYSGSNAIHDILEQTLRGREPQRMLKLLNLLDKLVQQVPIWEMYCNMDPQAARVSHAAMSAARKDDTK